MVRLSICTLVQATHTDAFERRNKWNASACNFPKLVTWA